MRFSVLHSLLATVLLLSASAFAEEAPKPSYVYRAEFVRVVDDHTVALDVDLGFGVWMHNQNLTLAGLENATASDPSKTAAKLRDLLKDRSEIIIQTTKDKKTGRYLVTVWADGVKVNDEVNKPAP